MNMIEKHQQQQLVEGITRFQEPIDSAPNLITLILRWWRTILFTALIMCAIGVPAIWLAVKPTYSATAAIRVAPVIPSILFKDGDSDSVIPMYKNFMNTQADLIKSDQVLQRVADDFAQKNLLFFEGNLSPVAKLRDALIKGDIAVAPERNSELIKIRMESQKLEEAAQVVDAFVRAYMAIEVSKETKGGDHKLSILESERKVLADRLELQRQSIRQMAEEYGAMALTERQGMMMQRVASLQAELTKIQTRKIDFEAQIQLLEQTEQQYIPPEKSFKLRHEFVNNDLTIQTLTHNIAQVEQQLVIARRTLAPTNPAIKQKADILEALKLRLEERYQQIGDDFDEMIMKEFAKNRESRSANMKIELAQLADYERRLQDMQVKENIDTIELGRKHLAIQDQQEQLGLTKELYDTVRRRIQELEMERKRPARISVAYNANVTLVPNKRIKYTAALILGSLACGVLLAFSKDKADHSLYTPQDITKRIGIRIIGTTTNSDYLDKPKLLRQVADDYQAIRANLGLLDGSGIPRKLVVTSPGVRDGKTTFAINFAKTLAEVDKKVLLIDGDLRKPDIRRLLNLPKGSGGLRSVLFGKSFENVVNPVQSMGIDVLTIDSKDVSDAFELLSSPHVSEHINTISRKYDHVVIDTPPVLAFPDALLWAKMADGVILTSFAGHTEEQDLKETLERLTQVKARILGTILNSVRPNYSYNRYSYSYYTKPARTRRSSRRNSRAMLLLPAIKRDKTPDDSKS